MARLDARTGRTLDSVEAPKGDLWLATVHDDTAYYARWEDGTGVSAAFFVQDLGSGKTRRVDFPWSVESEAPPLVHGATMYPSTTATRPCSPSISNAGSRCGPARASCASSANLLITRTGCTS
jgi:hypothetical protein